MTKVFISYSRKDKDFAGRFTKRLENSELETWIDWEDIPPTADWMDQIHKGIEESDAFLFLLSPDSIASRVCGQEVDHAVKNGKRLIPIVARDINANDVHPALGKVNWIYCRETDDFEEAVNKTLTAIRTDLAWVEFHRRLQVRALEWDKRSDRSLLLRGKDLREAEEQLAGVGQKDPPPTDLQRRYVLESRRGESRTRSLLLAASAVVMVVLAIASFIAVRQSNYAVEQANTAVAANATAVMEANTRATAQANAEEQTRIALSNGLASSALLLQEKKEISLAFLLAVQANQTSETARSRNALYTLLKENEYMIAALGLPDPVIESFPSFQANATNDYLMARISDRLPDAPDAQFILWDLHDFQLLDNEILPTNSSISINTVTRQLLSDETGEPLHAWIEHPNMDDRFLGPFINEVEKVIVLTESGTAVASYCKFSKHMASRCVQLAVYLFDPEHAFFSPQEIPTPETSLNFLEIAYDQNNQLFALSDMGKGVIGFWQELDGNLNPINSFDAPGFISLRENIGFEYNPDLQLAAWGTADNKIIVWDLSHMAVAQEYQFDFPFSDFVISPDGTMLAIRTETGTKVFTRHQADLQPLETGIDPAITGPMGFGGSGRIFAVGNGTQMWVFDTTTWSQITKIRITSTGDSVIYSLFVNTDGTTLAVGMRPVQAGPIEASYLIDIKTGTETGPFSEIMTPILSPNNYHLASMGSYQHEDITLWNLDVNSWKARACQIANRNLTLEEWGQYMGNSPYQRTCPNLPAPANP